MTLKEQRMEPNKIARLAMTFVVGIVMLVCVFVQADNTYAAANTVLNVTKGTEYESIDDAVAAADSGDELSLLTDIDKTSSTRLSTIIPANKSLTIDGNGHTIYGNGFTIWGNLVLSNITIDGAGKTYKSSHSVQESWQLQLIPAASDRWAFMCVSKGGSLQMKSGTTFKSAVGEYGPILCMGEIVMEDNTLITDLKGNYGCIRIYYSKDAIFTMKGGEIINNSSNSSSTEGVVFYIGGEEVGVGAANINNPRPGSKLVIEGGRVISNTSSGKPSLGVVFFNEYYSGEFTMTGGEITGNIAELGGGVYSKSKAPVISVGGSAKIYDNVGVNSSVNGVSNIYLTSFLSDDNLVKIIQPINDDCKVGLYLKDVDVLTETSDVKVAVGATSKEQLKHFLSDNSKVADLIYCDGEHDYNRAGQLIEANHSHEGAVAGTLYFSAASKSLVNYDVTYKSGINSNQFTVTVSGDDPVQNLQYNRFDANSGMRFEGWTIEGGDGTIYKEATEYTFSENVTFVAKWIENVPPTGAINVRDLTWEDTNSETTDRIFFLNGEKVTIEASDEGGITNDSAISYIVSEDRLSLVSLTHATDWQAYDEDNKPELLAGKKCYVYAKLTDDAGNVSYLESDAIVSYANSTGDIEPAKINEGSSSDLTFSVNLNGNTVASVKIGDTKLASSDYTVLEAGEITIKGDALKNLEADVYDVVVSFNPIGIRYFDREGNDEPEDVSFNLTVKKLITPTGKISIKSNEWASLSDGNGDTSFRKNSCAVTVEASDEESLPDDAVSYVVSDEKMTKAMLDAETSWETYHGAEKQSLLKKIFARSTPDKIVLDAPSRSYVYVKIVDNDGLITYLGTDLIVVYKDSAAITDKVEVYLDNLSDQTSKVALNGNTIASVSVDGVELSEDDYSVEDGTITFKEAYLENLEIGTHEVIVTYNPLGLKYVDAEGNEEPEVTSFTISVEEETPVVTPDNTDKDDKVDTSDSSNLLLYLAVLVAAVIALGAIVIIRIKRK